MPLDEREQQEAYKKSWRKITSTKWLFPTHYNEPVTMLEYMEEWSRLRGEFFAFRGPMAYEAALIEKYKDNVVATNQVFTEDGRSWLDTIVQLDRDTHLLANWNWSLEEAKHKLSVGLYVKDPAAYAKFLTEHESYEFKESPRNAGFAQGGGHFGGR